MSFSSRRARYFCFYVHSFRWWVSNSRLWPHQVFSVSFWAKISIWIFEMHSEFVRVVKDDEAVAQLSQTLGGKDECPHTHICNTVGQEDPLWDHAALTRTLLLVGRHGVQFAAVCVVCVRRRFVHTLLHALHHQIQQRQHGLVHLRTGRRTRLEVGNSGKEETNTNIRWRSLDSLKNIQTIQKCYICSYIMTDMDILNLLNKIKQKRKYGLLYAKSIKILYMIQKYVNNSMILYIVMYKKIEKIFILLCVYIYIYIIIPFIIIIFYVF